MTRVYRPGRSGAAAVLGPLEGEIMEALWEAAAAQTVADVQARLQGPERTVSYSAIKTVLNNLCDKGHLAKGTLGRCTIFRPKLNRDEFEAGVVRNLIASIRRDYGPATLLHLVDEVAADMGGLERLEALVARHRAERNGRPVADDPGAPAPPPSRPSRRPR